MNAAHRLHTRCIGPSCPCGGSALELGRQVAGLCAVAAKAATAANIARARVAIDPSGLRTSRGQLTRVSGVVKNADGKDAVRVRCHRGHEYALILTAWTAHIFGTRGCAVCCSHKRRKKAAND